MVNVRGSRPSSRSRFLLLASAGMAAATGFGSLVSLAKNVPGEPFGIGMKLSVAEALTLGLGSGLAAPWPMPVIAGSAAIAAQSGDSSRRPARICQTIGMMVLVGTLVEPVTWGLRSRSPWVTATVAANLIAGATLALAGRRASLRSPS